MRPGSIGHRFLQMVEAAGEAGLSTKDALAALGCSDRVLNQSRHKLRGYGKTFYSCLLGHNGGALYFSRADWCEAAKQAQAERARAKRFTPDGKRDRSGERESHARQQRERIEHMRLHEPEKYAAYRAKKRAQKRDYDARKRAERGEQPRPPRQAKPAPIERKPGRAAHLHRPKPVLVGKKPAPAPKPVAAGPADYSRAQRIVIETPRGRFEPAGPVPSVVDPGQCRPWAMAATRSAA
jgi:hypothetical protein